MQFLAFVLASLAASVFADNIVLTTPAEVVQCAETDISWTGGTAPYYVVVEDNGDIVGEADLVFDTSYGWGGYGCPAGSSIVFSVTDYHGDGATSPAIIVSNSSDTGCLGPSA